MNEALSDQSGDVGLAYAEEAPPRAVPAHNPYPRVDLAVRSDTPAPPLRIVHVLRAPVGGLFRHVIDLTREQIARGHAVGLIADQLTGGARGEALLAELEPKLALGLTRLPIQRAPNAGDVAALVKISKRLAELDPDVVHGHGSKGGLFARMAGLPFAPVKGARCYTPHGGSLNYLPGSRRHDAYMLVEAALARRTDLLLFESGFIAARFEAEVGRPRRLAKIVRNGVAPSELEPVTPNPDAAELLYVGEFRSVKGLDTLLDALALLAKADRRPKLALVGDGPDKAYLLSRAEELGVAAQILVKAPMAAREAFAQGRILVVPSRLESLPYILLEAAGAHKPIVATDVGGVPEIFGPYADRLIPCDQPETLAGAIRAALDADEAKAAREAAELANYIAANFSLETMVDDIIDGYRAALAARRRK
jgi:glycosyltransferase involved in cell wall biosynthesis